MWKAFLAVAYKEILHTRRDKNSLFMMMVFQGVYLLMLGFIDMNVHDMPTVIVDQDQSSESRELLQKLSATRAFDIKYVTTSVELAREHIRGGRARVAIIIPPDYHRERSRGGRAQILALVDGSDSISSGQAVAVVDGIAAQMNLELQRDSADKEGTAFVEPHSVLMFNPQGRNADFILPGLLAFIMSIGFTILSAFAFVREREKGTLDRLLMTRLNPTGLLLGKLAPYFVFGVFDSVLYLIAMRWGFGVPIRGNIFVLIVLMSLYVLTILSFGALLGSTARSFAEASAPINLVEMASTFLTGYIWPLSSIPTVLHPIAYMLPPTHMIAVMRGMCLRGATALDLLPHVAYLVVAPVVLLTLAVKRFQGAVQQ